MSSNSLDWDSLQVQSPLESMHNICLTHIDGHEARLADSSSVPHFEFAAWLKLKNTVGLPVMLVIEYKDSQSSRWMIVDTARISTKKSSILLAGAIDLEVKQFKSLDLYICHSNPALKCNIEEIRFNNQLIEREYVEHAYVA